MDNITLAVPIVIWKLMLLASTVSCCFIQSPQIRVDNKQMIAMTAVTVVMIFIGILLF